MSFRSKSKYATTLASCILALAACGDDSSDGDTETRDGSTASPDAGHDSSTGIDSSTQTRDASSDSSTSTNGDAATRADTGTPDSGSDSGTGSTEIPVLNGCAAADYKDLSSMATPTINFGKSGNVYDPKCAIISAGQSVVFSGAFAAHPLAKGTPSDANAGSANNPISNGTGNSKTISFPTAGTYPYYCTVHETLGMVGSIHVK